MTFSERSKSNFFGAVLAGAMLVAGYGLGNRLPVTHADEAPVKRTDPTVALAKGQAFEYDVATSIQNPSLGGDMKARLGKLGEDGWEVVAVQEQGGGKFFAVIKRPR